MQTLELLDSGKPFMRHPQLVICDTEGEVARLVTELAAEHRWLIHQPKKDDTALSLVGDSRPSVLIVRFVPSDVGLDRCVLLTQVHQRHPDVPIVAISDSKMPDADRIAWTAVILDLGARYVLFPPITKSVLEDTVSGLMAAAIQRVVGPSPRLPAQESILDLAEEEQPG